MLSSFRRLLTPLSYLRIERDGKLFDEVLLPAALVIVTLIFFNALSGNITIFGRDGVISSVVGYLQIVTGFYIASLAAVATFNKESMDELMPGTPTVLHVKRKGKTKEEKLSRRRFLCYLFGYLSFISLALYFSGSAINLSASPMKEILEQKHHFYAKWGITSLYLFIVYNMLITTLLGLYYMTDRIHRPASTLSSTTASPKSNYSPDNDLLDDDDE